MKNLILSLFIFLFVSANVKANNWIYSYDEAKKLAAATNKLILVDFWANWCGPCKKMDADVWSKPEIKELMKNYIPLKVDIDSERSISAKYSIRSIPDVFIMDANGEIIMHQIGYMDKNKVQRLLRKYSYNTKLVQGQIISYMKQNTGDKALAVAEKYFDLSIYVRKEARNDFFNLGRTYLKNASKLYKKEGNKRKNQQRILLLKEAYNDLIKGKYNKAIKSLDKSFKKGVVGIEETNKELYTFIKFVAYQKLNERENAKIWYEKLKNYDNYKQLFLKSRKI